LNGAFLQLILIKVTGAQPRDHESPETSELAAS